MIVEITSNGDVRTLVSFVNQFDNSSEFFVDSRFFFRLSSVHGDIDSADCSDFFRHPSRMFENDNRNYLIVPARPFKEVEVQTLLDEDSVACSRLLDVR